MKNKHIKNYEIYTGQSFKEFVLKYALMVIVIPLINLICLKISQYSNVTLSILTCSIILLMLFCGSKLNNFLYFGKRDCFNLTCVNSFDIYKDYYWIDYFSLIITFILMVVFSDVTRIIAGFEIDFITSIINILFFVFLIGCSPFLFTIKSAAKGGLLIAGYSFIMIIICFFPIICDTKGSSIYIILVLLFTDLSVIYLPSKRWLNIMEKKYKKEN